MVRISPLWAGLWSPPLLSLQVEVKASIGTIQQIYSCECPSRCPVRDIDGAVRMRAPLGDPEPAGWYVRPTSAVVWKNYGTCLPDCVVPPSVQSRVRRWSRTEVRFSIRARVVEIYPIIQGLPRER
jgi:hypothetical protein